VLVDTVADPGADTIADTAPDIPRDPAADLVEDTPEDTPEDTAVDTIPDCDTVSSPPDCPGVGIFETQFDTIVRSLGTPRIRLALSHSSWSQLRIVLTGADGSESVLWNRSTGTPPSTFDITAMTGAWMTGRYQLRIEDHVDGTTGTLTGWTIMAN
jgi:subtilisin-like proprotein convertase family protein